MHGLSVLQKNSSSHFSLLEAYTLLFPCLAVAYAYSHSSASQKRGFALLGLRIEDEVFMAMGQCAEKMRYVSLMDSFFFLWHFLGVLFAGCMGFEIRAIRKFHDRNKQRCWCIGAP